MTPRTLEDGLPPHDFNTEAAFVGALLLGNDGAIGEVMAEHPQAAEYCYDLRNKTIFGSIKSLFDGGKRVDVVAVQSDLKKRGLLDDAGGLEYLAGLPDRAPSAVMASQYATDLRLYFTKRRCLQAAGEVSAAARNGSSEADLLDLAERCLNGISTSNQPSEQDMRSLVRSAIDEIEENCQHRGVIRGITTGFAHLDRILHGLRPGQVFVIGARPSVGKTSLAMNIAEHVGIYCKRTVGFLELEMTAKELVMRMMSSRSNIPLDRMMTGELENADVRALTVADSAIAAAPIHISDEAGITMSQVRAKARRLHRRHKLELVIIDYLQLIRPARSNQKRNDEVAEISCSLKALAKELGLPIIVLSQLNRDSDSEERPPRLRDLRDSGSIEQDADIVGLLHPDPKSKTVFLDIAKNRQGRKDKIALDFDGAVFRFSDRKSYPDPTPIQP